MSLLGLFVFVFPARAAYILETGSVINGYRSCTWRDNGNGTSTLSLSVNFKWGFDSTNGVFWTRGFLIYAYDKNGKMKPSDAIASTVWLNGISHSGNYLGDGYTMYHGAYIGPTLNGKEQWINSSPFSANVEFLIYNSMISDWPAISIRAGNFTKGNDIGEVTGAAYFSRYNGGPNCQVIDPVKPPPPTIGINMTAPDWNLGELRRGEGEKVLSSSSDQLCFTYIGASASGKQFIINAGSANGVAGNRYRLKNLNDATQLVPYSLTLDSGTSNVSLPNASNKSLSLNSSGKTCFVPTFKTTVDQTVDEGDYSDVLTFTVITKS
ncbi:hypothetical protein [Burkholderia stagnalis]|uniref:hypothetical protein n=1 Tax=Burkholderia stagnalis TaxID=1503054 RepID=UPI000F80AEB9|nr:hypothetical protein [Burkholderia stagnalis]